MEKIKCLRCDTEMKHIATEKIQLGKTGWILGDLSNLISGALDVDIFACSNCGKIEFFNPDNDIQKEEIPQAECPNCGKMHDFDYPKCPFCKYDHNAGYGSQFS